MSNEPQFFQTRMGMKFYEGTMPRIAEALMTIAAEMESAAASRGAPAPYAETLKAEGAMTNVQMFTAIERDMVDLGRRVLSLEAWVDLPRRQVADPPGTEGDPVDVNREAALADLLQLAESVIGDDPGRREHEPLNAWHDRLAEWAMDATKLAVDLRDLLKEKK